MNSQTEYKLDKQEIEHETDAEIAFGRYLESSGVDCDDFMAQWGISRAQFNLISHFVYGLTYDISSLPSALAALLKVSRNLSLAA